MALLPSRVKYRKAQRRYQKTNATRGNTVVFGDYGLQILSTGYVSAREIEAGRVSANHYLHREGRVYVRIFPHKPVSAKPVETRMGKGKGDPDHWVACVRAGQIVFEVGGVAERVAKEALVRVSRKMPFRCRFVKRSGRR